jgi:glycerophosphoryl diester phosphodiesterase
LNLDVFRVGKKPLVIAHRGACGYEPENTFASFDLAVKMKADLIEFDVHLTKDKIPVVIHDETLDRTTDGTGEVGAKTFNQLRELNAAKFAKSHERQVIPSLEEIITRYKNVVGFDLEIKQGSRIYPGIETRVIDLLRKHSALQNCEITSFDVDAIKKVRAIAPEIITGIIFEGEVSDYVSLAKEIGCKLIDASNPLSSKEIETIHSSGLALNSWTFNEVEDIRAAIEDLKPDGLTTEYPDRAVKLLS